MQLMQEQHYWREVHRLSTQAEEAHAALDRFLESVRAPFTEEELAAYDGRPQKLSATLDRFGKVLPCLITNSAL